ncbi:hypothetical protein KIL84_019382 [Mauremys mutica]|uniref:Uncharacterized protein n=1 Tax=Mauremys mutica TaxID=74926 RepID=A0A9D3XUZ4_9SAUR|nr:hypothetical protein KIL84_019382 [Mauremys mutica]
MVGHDALLSQNGSLLASQSGMRTDSSQVPREDKVTLLLKLVPEQALEEKEQQHVLSPYLKELFDCPSPLKNSPLRQTWKGQKPPLIPCQVHGKRRKKGKENGGPGKHNTQDKCVYELLENGVGVPGMKTDLITRLAPLERFELNNEVHDDILFCQPMPTHTTGEAIFKVIDDFIKNSDLDWSHCVGISMDGARAMIGLKKGVVAYIQAVAPEAKSTHCCIHREALATQNMQADLKQALDEAVKIINFVKGRPLNAQLFSQLCDEMGSDFTQLLFHTEVHWLSREKVLIHRFELREELQYFLD